MEKQIAQTGEEEIEIDLVELFYAVLKKAWLVAVFFIIGLLAGFIIRLPRFWRLWHMR